MNSKPLPKTYKGYETAQLLEVLELSAMPPTGEGGTYSKEQEAMFRKIPREMSRAADQLDMEYLVSEMMQLGEEAHQRVSGRQRS